MPWAAEIVWVKNIKPQRCKRYKILQKILWKESQTSNLRSRNEKALPVKVNLFHSSVAHETKTPDIFALVQGEYT